MGVVFIILDNSTVTGSIRVGRTEEGTESTRSEMTDLLGVNLSENLSRWVGEGDRIFGFQKVLSKHDVLQLR